MPASFIHVVTDGKISFISMAEFYIYIYGRESGREQKTPSCVERQIPPEGRGVEKAGPLRPGILSQMHQLDGSLPCPLGEQEVINSLVDIFCLTDCVGYSGAQI